MTATTRCSGGTSIRTFLPIHVLLFYYASVAFVMVTAVFTSVMEGSLGREGRQKRFG